MNLATLRALLNSAERILTLTNCTEGKSIDYWALVRRLRAYGLNIPGFDIEMEDVYRPILGDFARPAIEMYIGQSFRAMVKLTKALEGVGKRVDLYVISGRYGVIKGDTVIIPYEASLNSLNRAQLTEWSRRMGIGEKLLGIIRGYDLVIASLTAKYAEALGEALDELLNMANAILIIPRSVVKGNARAQILPVKGPWDRVKYLKILGELIYGN